MMSSLNDGTYPAWATLVALVVVIGVIVGLVELIP